MAEQHKQYAQGECGELYGYTGKDAPAGTKALVEEDGTTLTPDGLKFCQKRGYSSPMVASIRFIYDQYHSPAVGNAIEAQLRNSELILTRQNKTKEISERLRLDWETQDKAFKANAAAAKKKQIPA